MATPFPDSAVNELPPELPGALTFHLPMELAALRDAGASDEELAARTEARLDEAFRAGLVDPPLYRWAVDRYSATADDLMSGDAARVTTALDDIGPLAEGLAGAAFHGLIRLGYGVWTRDVAEVARGLAYLRTRRQVLVAGSGARCSDLRADGDLPPMSERGGVTVFDLLNFAAGAHACIEPDARSSTPRALTASATAAARRNPSSFVAVHAVTGLHALCELEALVSGGEVGGERRPASLDIWWHHLAVALRACSLIVESSPPEAVAAYDGALGAADDIDGLVRASIGSFETHDVKLAVSLRRLVRFGLIDEADACEVGRARLGAATLDAI